MSKETSLLQEYETRGKMQALLTSSKIQMTSLALNVPDSDESYVMYRMYFKSVLEAVQTFHIQNKKPLKSCSEIPIHGS